MELQRRSLQRMSDFESATRAMSSVSSQVWISVRELFETAYKKHEVWKIVIPFAVEAWISVRAAPKRMPTMMTQWGHSCSGGAIASPRHRFPCGRDGGTPLILDIKQCFHMVGPGEVHPLRPLSRYNPVIPKPRYICPGT